MKSKLLGAAFLMLAGLAHPGWIKALAADPAAIAAKKEEIHRCLLNCYRETSRIKEAESECRALVALKPGDASLRYLLGDLLLKSGRVGEAASHFKKAVQLDPGKGDYQAALGSVLLSLKDYNGAVSAYRAAVSAPDGARFTAHLQTAMTYQANQTQTVQYQKQKQRQDDDE